MTVQSVKIHASLFDKKTDINFKITFSLSCTIVQLSEYYKKVDKIQIKNINNKKHGKTPCSLCMHDDVSLLSSLKRDFFFIFQNELWLYDRKCLYFPNCSQQRHQHTRLVTSFKLIIQALLWTTRATWRVNCLILLSRKKSHFVVVFLSAIFIALLLCISSYCDPYQTFFPLRLLKKKEADLLCFIMLTTKKFSNSIHLSSSSPE